MDSMDSAGRPPWRPATHINSCLPRSAANAARNGVGDPRGGYGMGRFSVTIFENSDILNYNYKILYYNYKIQYSIYFFFSKAQCDSMSRPMQ